MLGRQPAVARVRLLPAVARVRQPAGGVAVAGHRHPLPLECVAWVTPVAKWVAAAGRQVVPQLAPLAPSLLAAEVPLAAVVPLAVAAVPLVVAAQPVVAAPLVVAQPVAAVPAVETLLAAAVRHPPRVALVALAGVAASWPSTRGAMVVLLGGIQIVMYATTVRPARRNPLSGMSFTHYCSAIISVAALRQFPLMARVATCASIWRQWRLPFVRLSPLLPSRAAARIPPLLSH